MNDRYWGQIVSYSFPDVRYDRDAIKDSLERHGFDRAICKPIRNTTAFLRAIKENYEWTGETLKDQKLFLDMQYTETIKTREEIIRRPVCVVRLTKKNGDVSCEDRPRVAEVISSAMRKIQEHRGSQDVSPILKSLLYQVDCYHLGQGKGWFLPIEFAEHVERVSQVARDIGGELYRLIITKGIADNRVGVAGIVRSCLAGKLSGYTESSKQKMTFDFADKMVTRMNQFLAVVARAEKQCEVDFSELCTEASGLRERFKQARDENREQMRLSK